MLHGRTCFSSCSRRRRLIRGHSLRPSNGTRRCRPPAARCLPWRGRRRDAAQRWPRRRRQWDCLGAARAQVFPLRSRGRGCRRAPGRARSQCSGGACATRGEGKGTTSVLHRRQAPRRPRRWRPRPLPRAEVQQRGRDGRRWRGRGLRGRYGADPAARRLGNAAGRPPVGIGVLLLNRRGSRAPGEAIRPRRRRGLRNEHGDRPANLRHCPRKRPAAARPCQERPCVDI
mmetsp:Transcript_47615/g.153080  ORF Transcript_47615/g.153080 Transcript_47615/m.153080 type:complete len:229 (-) Transcript_47615:17-703(-)